MRTTGRVRRWAACLLAAGVVGAPFPSFGQSNQTSKFYVADLQGEAHVNTGERIEKLDEKSVYPAEGTIIETAPSSRMALVFSNGTGVYFTPGTRLEIKRFVQEPFPPNRNDIETEPSISQTQVYLRRGMIGLFAAKLAAGSTMTYATPHASISIRGRKVLIETTDYETRIALLEGAVTVRMGELDAAGKALRSGEQAIIRQPPGQAPQFLVQPIPDDHLPAVDEMVAMAHMARSTVYFDVVDRESAQANKDAPGGVFSPGEDDEPEREIIAIQVTPIVPPVDVVDENTVSASRIRS